MTHGHWQFSLPHLNPQPPTKGGRADLGRSRQGVVDSTKWRTQVVCGIGSSTAWIAERGNKHIRGCNKLARDNFLSMPGLRVCQSGAAGATGAKT